MPVMIQTHYATPLRPHLTEWVAGADHVDIAVAYFGRDGLDLLTEFLKSASVDLTVSLYLRGTRKRVLEALEARLTGEGPEGHRLRVRVAQRLDKGGFHGKLVRFSYPDRGTARLVVGSVNWTGHGLESLGEVSVVLYGEADEEALALPALPAQAVVLTDWASADDPGPLHYAIVGYQDQRRFPGLDDRLSSRFWRLAGVVDAAEPEDKLVAEVQNGAAPFGDGDGEHASEATFTSPVGGTTERATRRIAASVSVGDIVFEQAKDPDDRDDRICRVVGTWRGRPPGKRLDRVVLFYEVLSDAIPEGLRASSSGALSLPQVREHCPAVLADEARTER